MRQRQLRRRCEKLIEPLELPQPFSVEALVESLAQRRGRPLRVQPLPGGPVPAGPHGFWLATDKKDYIFFEPRTSRLHQEHIILHEIGHMISHEETSPRCRDSSLGVPDKTQLYRLVPLLDPGLVQRLLERSYATSIEEQEAEMIATLILEKAKRFPAPSPLTGTPARLEAALGYHRR